MDSCTLSDDEIVEFCRSPISQKLSLDSSGRKVIKLTDDIAVKFGLGVTIQEANAQKLAARKVCAEIVRIPRVFRFFIKQDEFGYSIGYLVMERVHGIVLEKINWKEPGVLRSVLAALNAIHSITDTRPGPVSGGEAHGSLWSELGSNRDFDDTYDLETYLNRRLAYFDETTQVSDETFHLCHMDVAPRNFMLDTQGHLYLIDWASAGFYPRYFELWAVEFKEHVIGESFGPHFLESLQPTALERGQILKLWLVYRFNSHFSMS
ncbi:MAG: hypothetical protein MMC23_000979 [Stictis urceolatum]|nr:hypothetical protein [Stictis urceolata]